MLNPMPAEALVRPRRRPFFLEVRDGMPSQVKKEKVKQIKKWFDDTDSLIVLHYKGLKVSEANELRKILTEQGGRLRVLKNTLTRIALKGTEHEDLMPLIDGPVAVVFTDRDASVLARTIREFARGREELYFQGGLLEDRVLSRVEMETVSTLPSREVLLGRLVGQVSAPMFGLVNVCIGPLRAFLGLFNALKAKKEQEEKAAVSGASSEVAGSEAESAGEEVTGTDSGVPDGDRVEAEEESAGEGDDNEESPAGEEEKPVEAGD